VTQESGGGGRHFFFQFPGHHVPTKARIFGEDGPEVDVRGDGGFIVVEPSQHHSGGVYSFILPPDREELAPLPAWVISQLEGADSRKDWGQIAQGVPEGQRNDTLTSYIGKVLAGLAPGLWPTAGWDAARGFALRCDPPLPEEEARKIFESICQREAAKRKGAKPAKTVTPATWEQVEAAFKRWLELPDMDAVRVVLAIVIANRLPGDPVWLFLVAPPSSAKTEIIQSLNSLPDIYPLTMLTPNTFLSGKKPEDQKGTISLLPKLNGKILCLKDFAPILDLHRDARQAILAQLRDIYDGSTAKAVGNEQRTMRWQGKMGFIAGVTQALDSYSSLLSLLGERFLQYRIPAADERSVMKRALRNAGKEKAMRRELKEVVAGFLSTIPTDEMDVEIPASIYNKLEALVRLVIRGRTGVIRDSMGKREIIYAPDHEGPARLAKQLTTLLTALARLREDSVITHEDYCLGYKCGLDSIHKMRRAILEELASCSKPLKTSEIAQAIDLSTPATLRYLDDLRAVGLLDRTKDGDYETAPLVWSLRPEIRQWWEEAKP
jgi:hypothetical protein